MNTADFARGFRLVYPDGYSIDGAQFPSGRCVLDDSVSGLVAAAVDLESLSLRRPGDRIVWADSGDPEGPCACGGGGWVTDENWEPEHPAEWDGRREPRNGLIPCGFCNPDGSNVR